MRLLSTIRRGRAPVGPRTATRHDPVSGSGARGGVRDSAPRARCGDAPDPPRWAGVRGRGRGAGAPAPAARQALAGLGISHPRGSAGGATGVRLGGASAAVPGARLHGQLGSEGEVDGEELSMTAPVVLNDETVRNTLRQVKDPELDMNISDLGLVYDVGIVDGDGRVKMTLTSPGGQAGAIVWARPRTGHRFERRAGGEDARLQPEVGGDPVAGALEALDPRLERRITRLAWCSLDTRQFALGQRQRSPHRPKQRGAMP